jgi:hypothetical protein
MIKITSTSEIKERRGQKLSIDWQEMQSDRGAAAATVTSDSILDEWQRYRAKNIRDNLG